MVLDGMFCRAIGRIENDSVVGVSVISSTAVRQMNRLLTAIIILQAVLSLMFAYKINDR